MKVIDIDLDFFLNDCCELAPEGERPPLPVHEPWSENAVRAFLENNCGLSNKHRIPGRVYETHDGSLRMWHELIGSGKLTAPFSVTHIDAHSDLGIGMPGPQFVLFNVLSYDPEKRPDIERYYRMNKLDEANYLLFALAFRWVNELINVRNPKSRPDIPPIAFKNMDGEYSIIRLESFISRLFESQNGPEPFIPFRVYADPFKFKADGAFDFASLAVSPRYSPKEADALIPVISEYMELI